jgi:hypothetical protein
MSGQIMKWSLSQNNIYFIFLAFERDTTNYRGTVVENVKKVKNQPTLVGSSLLSNVLIILPTAGSGPLGHNTHPNKEESFSVNKNYLLFRGVRNSQNAANHLPSLSFLTK